MPKFSRQTIGPNSPRRIPAPAQSNLGQAVSAIGGAVMDLEARQEKQRNDIDSASAKQAARDREKFLSGRYKEIESETRATQEYEGHPDRIVKEFEAFDSKAIEGKSPAFVNQYNNSRNINTLIATRSAHSFSSNGTMALRRDAAYGEAEGVLDAGDKYQWVGVGGILEENEGNIQDAITSGMREAPLRKQFDNNTKRMVTETILGVAETQGVDRALSMLGDAEVELLGDANVSRLRKQLKAQEIENLKDTTTEILTNGRVHLETLHDMQVSGAPMSEQLGYANQIQDENTRDRVMKAMNIKPPTGDKLSENHKTILNSSKQETISLNNEITALIGTAANPNTVGKHKDAVKKLQGLAERADTNAAIFRTLGDESGFMKATEQSIRIFSAIDGLDVDESFYYFGTSHRGNMFNRASEEMDNSRFNRGKIPPLNAAVWQSAFLTAFNESNQNPTSAKEVDEIINNAMSEASRADTNSFYSGASEATVTRLNDARVAQSATSGAVITKASPQDIASTAREFGDDTALQFGADHGYTEDEVQGILSSIEFNAVEVERSSFDELVASGMSTIEAADELTRQSIERSVERESVGESVELSEARSAAKNVAVLISGASELDFGSGRSGIGQEGIDISRASEGLSEFKNLISDALPSLGELTIMGAELFDKVAKPAQSFFEETRAGLALFETMVTAELIKQPSASKGVNVSNNTLEASIRDNEGVRKDSSGNHVVYKDHLGNLTVGVGHKVLPEDKLVLGQKVSDERVEELLKSDINNASILAKNSVDNFEELPELAQEVLTEMVFQMGGAGVKRFKNMRNALEQSPPDFKKAAKEMLDSLWAKQTPNRAKELAERMRSLS